MAASDYLFILFTILMVIAFPVWQHIETRQERKNVAIWIYIVIAVVYVGLTISALDQANKISGDLVTIHNRPTSDEGRTEFMTGIPETVTRNIDKSEDLFRQKDYSNAYTTIMRAINEYQALNIDVNRYIPLEHKKVVSYMFSAASRYSRDLGTLQS